MPLIHSGTQGVFVISVTPFGEDGTLDRDSLARVTDFYLEKGADGLTVLGMMGEAPKLSAEESREVVRITLARSGEAPVVVGISAPGLAAMRDLAGFAMDAGAGGVMVAPPSTLETNEQIVTYYANVVEAVGPDVPLVLQDFPLSTKVRISNGTLGAILEATPSVVMLKHEDWPGLEKITALRAAEAAGRRRTSILCGNGGIFLTEEMARGADGAMTGFGFPEMMRDVVALSRQGQTDRAQDIFDAYLPLVRYEQQPGLGLSLRKYVLAKRGAIASAALRKPGGSLSAAAVAEVERLLDRQARRLAELA
ncbi:dihydrodipicolinate synthase family protein [Celeribacter indicus]|uniref:Dihydrodipicolinate synthetase n=1 Tax=Celeribacter indicus TaxID=1208324 RepID=A0A0B5E3E5_9RHOB|nr:dihydrodipicolinate synthase family protein [Celeribacter indicus]AJE47581.1 dihydrodipicolinate synthetase [Celeribacter indicus]SDW10912.1 4-hydroxy-tetrahydrodipicolinate synthase [Celeribacter indicus]